LHDIVTVTGAGTPRIGRAILVITHREAAPILFGTNFDHPLHLLAHPLSRRERGWVRASRRAVLRSVALILTFSQREKGPMAARA
jgi:hypothetical protein